MAEFNLGPLGLNSTRSFINFVGNTDLQDTFRFTITALRNFNLSLTGMTQNANVQLFRDVNNNGIIDAGDGLPVASSIRVGASDDSLNIRLAAGGAYIARVFRVGPSNTNYRLRLSNTGGSPSNLLPIEFNAGTLTAVPFIRSDAVGARDTADTYRFRMATLGNFNASLTNITAGTNANMRLIRDVNNNRIVDAGDVLVTAAAIGNSDDAINVRSLAAGNYFLQTFRAVGNSNYRLRMSNSAGSPSNLLPAEINAGVLAATPFSRTDSLRTNDASDTYRFTMGTIGNFHATVTGIAAGNDIDIRLIRDTNNNRVIDAGDEVIRSANGSNNDDAISVRSLAAGNYFLQAYQFAGTSSSYTLRMSNTGNSGLAPSNLLSGEITTGALDITGVPFERSGFLETTNATDTYRFSMAAVGNFNASMTGIAVGNDLDMRLIQDANSNGLVDAGDVLVSSTLGGNVDASINVRSLAAGSYFLQTNLFSGTGSSYNLKMSDTGDSGSLPSNLLPTETNLGTVGPLSGSGNLTGTNASDTFRFDVAATQSVTVGLSGLAADADLRLILDSNSNGIVDAGEELGRSSGTSSTESITQTLAAGSYIAQVYLYATSGNTTSYSLSIA